jgi:glycosyltransferase involved in cell wall biosynthesis
MAMHHNQSPDILFVITGLQVGGSEGQLLLLAASLAKEGMAVAVFSFTDGPVRALLEQSGIEVILARGHGGTSAVAIPRAALALLRFMRQRRPHIVHFFLPAAYLVGAPMALLARVPVRVLSRRSLNNYQRYGFIRAMERCWHPAMQAVLGNSCRVIDQLKKEGVTRDRLGLIYNGIDDRRFATGGARETSRARMGLPPAALVMCIVANLIPYKGHRDLIDALASAGPRLPLGWRLLVVGRDDGIGPILRQQVERLGLEDNIVFLGSRDDITAILTASDMCVLCSHEEGFSNAILEAMAAGLPMVVTEVGGNAEAVLNGETGLVVPARDHESLAVAIVRLANDPILRARFGAAGRQRVVEHFGLQRFVQSHRELYDALRAGNQPADVPSVAIRG